MNGDRSIDAASELVIRLHKVMLPQLNGEPLRVVVPAVAMILIRMVRYVSSVARTNPADDIATVAAILTEIAREERYPMNEDHDTSLDGLIQRITCQEIGDAAAASIVGLQRSRGGLEHLDPEQFKLYSEAIRAGCIKR